MAKPIPAPFKPGEAVWVAKRPKCDACASNPSFNPEPVPALYDFRSRWGYWMNGCRWHYLSDRFHTTLGVGKGQYLLEIGGDNPGPTDDVPGLPHQAVGSSAVS